MFDISVVTCMAGWIEIKMEIFFLVILNNFIKAILMYFVIVLDWTVYRNYVDNYFMIVTIWNFVHVLSFLYYTVGQVQCCICNNTDVQWMNEWMNEWHNFRLICDHMTVRSTEVKKKKVKCTLVQALTLRTGRMAQWGSRGIALPFHDHGTRRGWGVSVTPRPLFTPGKDPVPIVQEAGWAPGPVWTGAENLAPTGIQSPDRPAHSQLLYRLCYLAHQVNRSLPKLCRIWMAMNLKSWY